MEDKQDVIAAIKELMDDLDLGTEDLIFAAKLTDTLLYVAHTICCNLGKTLTFEIEDK